MPDSSDFTEFPWLSSYPPTIAWDAPLEAQPVYALLDHTETTYPTHRCVDFLGRIYSYEQIGQAVRQLAGALIARGIGKGSKVGICLPNCPQFIISYFAILKTGATVVNFNPLYSAPEIHAQIQDSGTDLMITMSLANIYPKVAQQLDKSCLKHIIITHLQDALPPLKSLLFSIFQRSKIAHVPKDAQHTPWNDILRHAPIETLPTIQPEQDIAVLQYTGGTTGTPKGTMLTHANLYINAQQTALWFPNALYGEEKMMAVLPFFHVFAMTVVMNVGILLGAELILHPRFDLKNVLKDITKKKPTLMPGVPTMFAAINHCADLKKYNLRSIRSCFSGGAPLPVEVKKQFEALTGCVVVEGYGLSESSPVAAANPLQGVNKAGSIGLPVPGTIFEICDLNDPEKILPQGATGEICIRGPQIMQGYWKNPTETAQTLRGGRLHTGDVGYIDEEGYIFIVDRKKEMIISGGYNIYPRHVEEALYLHPAIMEAAVIGAPHELRGEVPEAYLVPKTGKTIDEKELRDFLKSHLPPYALPTRIHLLEQLPKTLIGKIDKKALKKNKN